MSVNGLALLTTILFLTFTAYVCWHAGRMHERDQQRRRNRVKRQMDTIRRHSVRSPW